MDFGKKLKQIRESKSLSIRELSKRANVSHAHISQIETGQRGTPKADTIKKLADGLNCDYEELMRLAGYGVSGIDQHPENETLPPGVPDYYKAFLEVIDDPNVSDASKELARLLLKTPLQPEQLDLLRGMIANFKAANK
ncbi:MULTISPECIES: helix-turn-helix domain-containing protein [Bacillales]|uniref:helix-turn-helix domain-containing protein n=1 Tax=Bacillales TaxID=1385 RepID=UPI0003774F2E|nr:MULTISPECIES: helix-turn-helix domain-containing protein [Bacillales]KMZ42552.1 XRE family transcriptional regulator [Bacillus sp. FJAT-27238]